MHTRQIIIMQLFVYLCILFYITTLKGMFIHFLFYLCII